MKSLFAKLFTLSTACLSLASAAEFSQDDPGIMVLDDSNFYTTAREKKFMLTMVYAPWCSHCTTLEPEVKAAAAELQKHGLVIAVVNGDSKTSEKLVKEWDIKSFPDFYWVEHGKKFTYRQDRDRNTMIKYVKQRAGLEASSKTNSKELACDEIEERTKKHRFTAITFANKNSQFFNWYQEMQQQFLDNRKKTGEDEDQILGEEQDGKATSEDMKLPKFNYYHSDPKCITHFYKDKVIDGQRGAMVMLTPGNQPELLEDDEKALGLSPYLMAGFMWRYTLPNFRKLTHLQFEDVIAPSKAQKENKQVGILLSRDPESEYPFRKIRAVSKEMKFKMTYWYLGHKKPTKKQKKIKEAAEARRKARDDKNKKAVDEVKAKKQKGTLSQDVKDFNAKVDQEAAALEASQAAEKFEYTTEEKEVFELMQNEEIFKWMLGSFMLKEVDLPAFVFYDPLDTVRGEKETKGAFWRSQTHMRSMTKESILEESNKFIGQWYRMFQKTEDVPTDYGMAHKTIVGQTFAEFVTNPETEVIMNYAKPWEPFCKLLQPEYIKLAEILKDVKGLKLATMDPEKNIVTFANHASYPTVVHFTKDNKRGRKIKFTNRKGKQIASIVEYLSKYSDAYIAHKKANPDFDPVEMAKTITVKLEAEYKKEYEAKKKEEEAAAKKKRDEEAAAQKAKQEAEEQAKKAKETIDLDAEEAKPKEPEAKQEL